MLRMGIPLVGIVVIGHLDLADDGVPVPECGRAPEMR